MTRVAVVAGIAPWRLVEPDDPNDPERELLALADAGRVDEALAGFRAMLTEQLGDVIARDDDDALVEAFLDDASPELLRWLDPDRRVRWARDLRLSLRSVDGYANDNVAWGGRWDIDVTAVRCPVRIYNGDQDLRVSQAHGRWLADHLVSAALIACPGAGHGMTCFSLWDEIFPSLRDGKN